MRVKNIAVLIGLAFLFLALLSSHTASDDIPRWEDAAYFFWVFWFGTFLTYLALYWQFRYRTLPIHAPGAEKFFLKHVLQWQEVGIGLFWLLVCFSLPPLYLNFLNVFYLLALFGGMWHICPDLLAKIFRLPDVYNQRYLKS